MMQKLSKIIYYIGRTLIDLIILSILFFFGINISIVQGTNNDILYVEDIKQPLDAVVVLGASVQGLQLSPILQDRVETAIQLYQDKKAKKIIVSGDNGSKYYNEVDAMYQYIRNRGIPAADIIKDVNGDSTYHSIKNVKQLMDIQTIGIVTQNFHLPRSIFIAQSIGLNAVGVISDRAPYVDSQKYEIRESFARIKALYDVLTYYIL